VFQSGQDQLHDSHGNTTRLLHPTQSQYTVLNQDCCNIMLACCIDDDNDDGCLFHTAVIGWISLQIGYTLTMQSNTQSKTRTKAKI